MELKLQTELVPKTSFYENVRSKMSRAMWDSIRRDCYRKANYKCEICGGVGNKHPVECHEVWDYDLATGIQRLIRMIALCPMCHKSKHFGLSCKLGMEEVVVAHMMKVNKVSRAVIVRHINKSVLLWEERNKINWRLDLRVIGVKFEG